MVKNHHEALETWKSIAMNIEHTLPPIMIDR